MRTAQRQVAWLLVAAALVGNLSVLTMTHVRRAREQRQSELLSQAVQFERAQSAAAILLAACDRIISPD